MHTLTFRGIPAPWGEMSTFLFIAMCAIALSFICIRSRQKILRNGYKIACRKKCEKKIRRRGFPKIAKKSEFFFTFLKKKAI